MPYVYVFIGGGLGSLIRYLASNFISNISNSYFPYGTLFVNVLGSLVIGYAFSIFEDNFNHLHTLRQFFFSGFLGGFTTFSSFSLETMHLIQKDIILGILNIFLNLFLCLSFVYIGYLLGKR